MKKTEYDEMISLQKRMDKLQLSLDKQGKIVTNALARLYEVEDNGDENNPKYARDFALGVMGDDYLDEHLVDHTWPAKPSRVYWWGAETWAYGGHQGHKGSFHVNWLFMTPEEIEAEVDKKIAQIKDARKRAEEAEAKRKEEEQEQRDRALYEQLKEKFEGNNG